MQLDYFTREKLRKEAINNMVYFVYGILSSLFLFNISQIIDVYFNTFDSPIAHLMIIPCAFSALACFLFYKFIGDSLFIRGWFVIGIFFGIVPVFNLSLNVPNVLNLPIEELIPYNLLRYFTPIIMYVSTSCVLYMIMKIKFNTEVYLAMNRAEIDKRIAEATIAYEENIKNGLIKEEDEDLNMVDKSRNIVERISDMIAKNIDPDYERTEHIVDIDVEKELEKRKEEKELKKKKKKK